MKRLITLTNRVYLEKCEEYDETVLREKLTYFIDNILKDNGFSSDFSGKKVVVKPNLLAKRTPDAGVTTSPVFVKIAAEYFVKRGAAVTIADSPGGLYNASSLTAIYRTTGMTDAASGSGAVLNEDYGYQTVTFDGEVTKNLHIINPIAECDLIVNVCRLKTHALCEMTAAVKNMFGSIPGLQKAEQHARFPQREKFASQLVDLCLATAPQINLVDIIVAMEGNGPASGTLKKVGAIAAGANPFAVDLLCSTLMGYQPNEVGTVAESIKRDLCPKESTELTVIGENPRDYTHEFVRPDGSAGGLFKQLPNMFGGKLQKWLEPRPVVNEKKCIGCGECKKCCPADTIEMRNKKAFIINEKCIKCYCCQELCPAKAINIKRSIFFKL
jgi:Uncharacterized conserved protein